jgi:hypothetical protein
MIESKPKKIIDTTLIIAIIPAYIYFVTFEYENGFCNNFGIPTYLIEPSLTTILIFATTLFGVFFSSIKALGLSLPFFKAVDDEKKTHLRGINKINGICIFGGILMIYAYPFSWKLILIISSVTLILNLITWGIPLLLLIRKKKSLKEKLQQVEDENVEDTDKIDWLVHLFKKLNNKERTFFFVILVIPYISFLFGNGEAMKQKEFLTICNNENTVVLKKYNDIFVCAKFNRKTNQLSDSLILIKLSESEPIILRTEKIGPLNTKY